MTEYSAFIDRKTQLGGMSGFDPIWMPSFLFDFQRSLVEWSLRKGKSLLAEDCGLGKTPQFLVWGENVVRKTNKPVLVLTPLAVSFQTILEANKFDIEAHRSSDGKVYPGINVTNYERLHYFNPDDFAGVICDECFARGTLVDTPYGKKHIENIRPGEYIVNCVGVDRVSDVHKREVQYATLVKVGGSSFIASPNHPIFTQRGWVGAQHLRSGDYALATGAAMSLVREGDDAKVSKPVRSAVLRDILLSEMAYDTAECVATGTYGGGSRSHRQEKGRVVGGRKPQSIEGNASYCGIESNKITGGASEDFHPIESHEAQTFRAWGQWPRDDVRASRDDGCTWTRMDSGISFVVGPTQSRLSNALQDRLRESADENRHRGGWQFAPRGNEESRRCQEGIDAAFTRVDGIEILERGNPRLEQLREEDGKLYFYDLGATRHPSYSVCGHLVHNSSILKNFDGAYKSQITEFMRKVEYRLCDTATAAPNDYIELGTTSEALGELGYMDMLSRFFKNDQGNTIKARTYLHRGSNLAQLEDAAKWRLKGHAEIPFWRWVCSWARAIRKPSDLGFDDARFILPPLIEKEYLVTAQTLAPGMLFPLPAVGLKEQREERRRTVTERCEKVASLVAEKINEPSLVWCHLNAEGDLLESMIPRSIQVKGSDSDEWKEGALMWFAGTKCICHDKLFRAKLSTWQKDLTATGKNIIASIASNCLSEQSNTRKKTETKNAHTYGNTMQTTNGCGNEQKDSKQKLWPTENADTTQMQLSEKNKLPHPRIIETGIQRAGSSEVLPGTGSQLSNTGNSLTPGALFAEAKPTGIKGDTDFISTTTTQPESLEDCSAQIAIMDSASSRMIQNVLNEQQCICGHRSGKRVLISKSVMFGFGLNFQACAHVTFFPSHSYEQYYQGVRRCYRFGQTRTVQVDVITTEGEQQVLKNLQRKSAQADKMFSELVKHMNDSERIARSVPFTKKEGMPAWLA